MSDAARRAGATGAADAATDASASADRATAADETIDSKPAANGYGLLALLAVVAFGLAIHRPLAPADWLKLVDWQTVGALAGLLAITQGVEQSGVLQAAARRVLARLTDQRALALWLIAGAAALSALVTNDVSLFLLMPLSRVLATQARLPFARLVVLEALAVNAGSALTPIGNPQNLYLWHRSGESFVGFMAMMAPTVAVMLFWLVATVCWLVPGRSIALRAPSGPAPVQPRLLALTGVLFVVFVVALEQRRLVAGLAVVGGSLLVLKPRVLLRIDWALLAIIALMFVDLRQLAALPQITAQLAQWQIAEGWRTYLAGVVGSQFISNVPATIVLDRHVHDLPALAAGVNVGGFGFVLGSLANLIALRLARLPNGWREFHRISIPFLVVCAASVLLLQLA